MGVRGILGPNKGGMMGAVNAIAFQAGEEEAEAVVGAGNATLEQIEACRPDTSIFSALSTDDLARLLGLTSEQASDRRDAWDAALQSYNDGYRTAARRALAEQTRRSRRSPSK